MPLAREYYFVLLVVAIKVRDKLVADTKRPNTPVRVLVLQANLLDRLTRKIEFLQKYLTPLRAVRGLPSPPGRFGAYHSGPDSWTEADEAICDDYIRFVKLSDKG